MPPNTTLIDHDSIALRAYYLWEAEGHPMGRHEAHWLAAEATEKRSLRARRAAATRRANQDVTQKAAFPEKTKVQAKAASRATPKATPETVVAASAVSKLGAASARTVRRTH